MRGPGLLFERDSCRARPLLLPPVRGPGLLPRTDRPDGRDPLRLTAAILVEVRRAVVEAGATRSPKWTTAVVAGVSQTAASQTWRASRLEPHLVEEFKVSPDPQPVDTARGVDGLHLNPPKAAAPRRADKKTGIQTTDCTAPTSRRRERVLFGGHDRHPDHRLHRPDPAFT